MARIALWHALLIGSLVGCSAEKRPSDKPAHSAERPVARQITLATTTSTQDSGLLDELLPVFERQTGIEVKVVAVGSGQALALGKRGDADVLLTHSPTAEQEFMEEGWGEERHRVMHNDLVLVGPTADPARIHGVASVVDAFFRIANEKALFVSRGDDSGTHHKEKEIWTKTGLPPQDEWYIEAGAGMAQTLRMASEKGAYAISDRATYLTLRNELELTILSEHDPIMRNNYAVLIPSSKKHPHVDTEAARQFADFLNSPATKKLISEYGVAEFGEPLFFLED